MCTKTTKHLPPSNGKKIVDIPSDLMPPPTSDHRSRFSSVRGDDATRGLKNFPARPRRGRRDVFHTQISTVSALDPLNMASEKECEILLQSWSNLQ